MGRAVAQAEVSDELIEKLFDEHGLKHTQQREAIVREFFSMKSHVSIDDLLARVRTQHPRVGYATVYRTLRRLKEVGVADERHFGDGKALFEPMSDHHHDHLICNTCQKIIEFENDEIEHLQEAVAKAHRFKIMGHKLEIYGICAECQRDAKQK